MGDLHCPATLLLAAYGDAAQAQALAARLRSRKVALVWSSDVAPARAYAQAVAAALGVGVSVRAELGVPDPDRVRDLLDEIADTHRGETVLVVTDDAGVRLVTGLLPSAPGLLADGGPLVELTADEHGWSRLA